MARSEAEIVLVAASRRTASARAANTAIGATYLLLGIIGLFIADAQNALNILAFNGWDNVLHFATALVLLGVALGTDKDARRTASGSEVSSVPGSIMSSRAFSAPSVSRRSSSTTRSAFDAKFE